jgi:hypothetical protein
MLFTAVSCVCLLVHHIIVRVMAHGDVAPLLLSGAHTPPPARAAALTLTLVMSRFVSVLLVPGLLLAATAELAAYLLVGPTRVEDLDDLLGADEDDEV